MSRLFVVATPIGNLGDLSARAASVLTAVSLIAAEDTRVARILLKGRPIHGRVVSYNEHNRGRRIPEILSALEDGDVALMSDAGTPAISDPGVELVAGARAGGHEVVSVPGPSSVVAALSVAGLRTTPFTFVGFLPRAQGELRRSLAAWLSRRETLVAFESPQRLRKSLQAVAETAPERRLAVCRELTKLHEEVFVGTAGQAIARFDEPRGEIVLVIEGADEPASGPPVDAGAIEAEVAQMKSLGLSRAQASALLESRYGLGRRRAYELWLKANG